MQKEYFHEYKVDKKGCLKQNTSNQKENIVYFITLKKLLIKTYN